MERFCRIYIRSVVMISALMYVGTLVAEQSHMLSLAMFIATLVVFAIPWHLMGKLDKVFVIQNKTPKSFKLFFISLAFPIYLALLLMGVLYDTSGVPIDFILLLFFLVALVVYVVALISLLLKLRKTHGFKFSAVLIYVFKLIALALLVWTMIAGFNYMEGNLGWVL